MANERFDARGVVEFFGGPGALARKATDAGYPLTVKAAEKWRERDAVPGVWFPRLSQIARREGRTFNIDDFMTGHPARKGKEA